MPSARPDVALYTTFVTRKSCLRRDFLVTKSSTKATYVTVVTKKSCLRRDFLVTKQLLREKQLLRRIIAREIVDFVAYNPCLAHVLHVDSFLIAACTC